MKGGIAKLISKEDAVVAALLALLAALLLLPIAFRPAGGDAAFYGYLGQRILAGDDMYRDMWDMKPPGFSMLFAFSYGAFGPSHWSPSLLEVVLAWAASLGVYRVAEHYSGRFGAVCGSVLFLFAFFGVCLSGFGLQAETMSAPFVIWPFALVIAKPVRPARALLAGALLTYAAAIKTSNIVFVIPWMVLGGFGSYLLFASVGGVAVAAAFALYLKSHGSLGEAKYALLEFGTKFVDQRRQPFAQFFHSFQKQIGGLIFATVACWAGLAFTFVRRERLAIAVAAALSLAIVFYQSRYFIYHWMPVYIFGAAGFGMLANDRTRSQPKNLALVALGLSLLFLIPKYGSYWSEVQKTASLATGRTTYKDYASTFHTAYGDAPGVDEKQVIELAEKIKAETTAEDYVFANHFSPAVALLSQRREPQRFIYFDGIEVQHRRQPEWSQEYVDRIIERRPKFIIVCRKFYPILGRAVDLMDEITRRPRLQAFFQANYNLRETLYGCVELYEIKP
ncbi:MAG: hypothetical protein U0R49_06855 [Fimbriimonadales bacterium]